MAKVKHTDDETTVQLYVVTYQRADGSTFQTWLDADADIPAKGDEVDIPVHTVERVTVVSVEDRSVPREDEEAPAPHPDDVTEEEVS